VSETPGHNKPQWRYRVADLEAFVAMRVVAPYVPTLRRVG
jgi:hypothetical protein